MYQYVGISDYSSLPEEPTLEYQSFKTLKDLGQFLLEKFNLDSASKEEIEDILTYQMVTMRNGERIFLEGVVEKKIDLWEK
jgi:hypothetical protein